MQNVKLSNGTEMPLEGFGVFQIPDGKKCEEAVLTALQAGYRLIDTAASYLNEEAVGSAIRKSGIPREEIFVTTKVWVQDFGYEQTKKAVELSLKKLGLEYIDLELLHQSMSDYYGAWRALEELYREGKIRAIGVSNFYPERITDLCMNVDIRPMVNQIECHPFWQRNIDLEVAKEFDIRVEAWAPFAEAGRKIFSNETICEIASKYNKTPAQVILRWNTQRGVIVIPKSVHKERIVENADIWDFTLSEEDMKQMLALDTGHPEIVDHYDWKIAKSFNEHKIHDEV